jgi:hypothetical protein
MKQINFYALKEDILPVLEEFDAAAGPMKYIPTGITDSPNYSIFKQGTAIPNLGNASNASAINCVSFLVSPADAEINLRALSATDGKRRFAIDQLKNPDTITFSPGGLWNNNILLHGRVATASASSVSQALIKRFQSTLKKTFVKVKAFHVGPQALALLKNGRRLTISAQSPQEFDLTFE